mgnify:CR=1 FL=1
MNGGRSKRIGVVTASLVSLVLVLAGCATVPVVETPSGFAGFSADEERAALSPEGVGFRVRAVANDPEQTLGFWSDALERHLVESGYLARERRGFVSPAGDGIAFEWIAQVGDADWAYLTAIVVAGETILLGEAAGPVKLYDRHRRALDDALATMDTGRAAGGR